MKLKTKKNCAFTFIQVMITVFIVMILLSFMVVGLNESLKRARRAKCESNLKQVYQYLMLYLDEHNDIIPLAKGIDESYEGDFLKNLLAQQAHEKDVFYCPSDPRNKATILNTGSYDWCAETLRGKNFSGIKDKRNTIIVGDFRAGWHDDNQGIWSWFFVDESKEQKINVLFADGHVEWITEQEWQENIKKA